jgi:hypothetical protein
MALFPTFQAISSWDVTKDTINYSIDNGWIEQAYAEVTVQKRVKVLIKRRKN